jgi:hypothetical protein
LLFHSIFFWLEMMMKVLDYVPRVRSM